MVVWRVEEEAKADEPSAKRLTLSLALFTAAVWKGVSWNPQSSVQTLHILQAGDQISHNIKFSSIGNYYYQNLSETIKTPVRLDLLHLKQSLLSNIAKRAHPSVASTPPALLLTIKSNWGTVCTFITSFSAERNNGEGVEPERERRAAALRAFSHPPDTK